MGAHLGFFWVNPMEPEPTDDIVIIHSTPEEFAEFPKEVSQENKICFSPEKKKKMRNDQTPPRIPSLLMLHVSPCWWLVKSRQSNPPSRDEYRRCSRPHNSRIQKRQRCIASETTSSTERKSLFKTQPCSLSTWRQATALEEHHNTTVECHLKPCNAAKHH